MATGMYLKKNGYSCVNWPW